MVKVTLAFSREDQSWTHDFEVEEGSTIMELKQKMVAPKGGPRGTKRDVDSFELRMRGQRVSDAEQIFQEHTLQFQYLGPEEGAKRAKEDVDNQKEREQAKAAAEKAKALAERTKKAAEEAAKRKAAQAPAAKGSGKPGGAPAAKAAAQSGSKTFKDLEVPECKGVPLWKVVGGGDKGGILVRQGLQTSSPQHTDRLSTGAIVEQIELEGERLNYRRVTGTGPQDGWVSLNVSGKELMKQARADEAFTLERAIQLQKDMINAFSAPAFVQTLASIDDAFPDKKGLSYAKNRNMAIFGAQRDIVAKFGFEGSQRGVIQMMGAFTPHMKKSEVQKNTEITNKLLGMA